MFSFDTSFKVYFPTEGHEPAVGAVAAAEGELVHY
jgi:hypothetical protein